MKRVLFFTLVILSATGSCKKHETLLMNEGVITGVDVRECLCTLTCPCSCSSLIFHFTNTGDSSRVIIDNGTIFNLTSNTQFPLNITLDWQSTTRCGIKAIKVLKYKML